MKFYIAASVEQMDQVDSLREYLESKGHKITYNWVPAVRSAFAGDHRTTRQLGNFGKMDLGGVEDADILILYAHPRGFGSIVEFGAALGQYKPVFVIGTPQDFFGSDRCPFFYLDNVFFTEEANIRAFFGGMM